MAAKYRSEHSFIDAGVDQALDAALRLRGFGGFGGLQIVKAATGVAVQSKETRLLAFQGIEAVEQRDVLRHIREIPGMVDVLVVHRGRHCACIDDKLVEIRVLAGIR